MSSKKCCKSCHHCCDGQFSYESWCRLRKVRVHNDLVTYAVCHHWTRKSPALPKLQLDKPDQAIDQQLELDRFLVLQDNR